MAGLDLAAAPKPAARKLVTAVGSNPTWSPDSTRIAFGHDGEGGIVTVRLDDLSTQKLADAGKDPAWSPDGQWLAYASTRDSFIYVLNLARPQSPIRVASGLYPQWLARTKELVYADPSARALVAVKIPSSSSGKPALSSRELTPINDPFVALSPSGDLLASLAKDGLVVAPLDGAGLSRQVFPRKGERGFLCDWSPDNRWLVVGGFLGSQLGLWIVDAEGKEAARRLVPAGVKPAWSPNGRWIAFDRAAGKDPGIEIIEVQAAKAQGPSEAELAAATARIPLTHLVVECPRSVYQPHRAEVDSFFQYADRNVPVAEEILGLKAGGKIVVRIEESEKTGCRCTEDVIYVSSRCLLEAPVRRWLHVAFPHEVVHWYLGNRVTPHFPAWFVEPPATFFGYQIARRLGQKEMADEDEAKFLRWAADYRKRGSKEVWLERFPPDTDNECRGMAYTILQTLAQRHGQDLFRKFLNAVLADGVDFAAISDVREKQRLMIRYLTQAAGRDLSRDFENWGFIDRKGN